MKKLNFIFILFSITTSAQTLEQFISHPIESNFAASPDGKHIAWVLNDHGKRNIWVKSGTDLPRQLTEYQSDDGQELSQLTFSPNGTKLLYVRGGAANRAGQNPNPASLSEGAEQAIYYKDILSKSPPAKIATGSNPVFFRDGIRFLFSKGGQIYESPLDINATPKLLFSARGGNHSPRFSPDGNEVLFVSDRGDHSFIGVYNLLRRSIRWIAPEVAHDNFPVWSPEGKQIAFIRTSATKIGALNNLTAGVKFEVWVADAQSGIAKPIWKSPADDGGFAQSYVNTPLAWLASGRILFFSEHQGWNHIYAISDTGSELKDITPGEGEVENFIPDATGKFIYFDGNREDINRRHIWKVDVTTGVPVAVTAGEGIEMYPALAGNVVYAFRSTATTSKTLVRIDEASKTTVPVNPQKLNTFSSAAFVKPEAVLLKAADGTTIHAQLFINHAASAKRPGIVFMHGGPIRQMLLGFHYSDYYINTYAFNQYLAAQGYAVLSVNFRSGTGYGRDFRRSKNQGPRGASEYQDIVAAAKHLQSLPEVEATKIGLWGGSYGGYLTAMGLSRNPEIFKAGVDVHGVHDWSFNGQDATNLWGLQKNELDVAVKSSPIADLSKWSGPVLMVHGDDDRNVNFQQTVDLVEKLRERKVPVEVFILPDEVHGFLRYESWKQVFEKAKDFFDRKLK
ncbi:MAG: prolyl oligopeptidase family serine peptidase [Cytophagales bacterium]|nr:prolyl oligopeptidase family serine peptidase [Cytophagales bacterium]